MTSTEHIVHVYIGLYLTEQRMSLDPSAVNCMERAVDSLPQCQTLLDQFVRDAQRLERAA